MDLLGIVLRTGAAFAIAFILTPLTRRWALSRGFVDRPGERKLHLEPVPLSGGLAIYAAVAGALLAFPAGVEPSRLWGLMAALTLVTATGLIDDYRGLSVAARLLAQLAAAGILVAAGLFVDLALPALIDGALTLLWIIGITNAFNLLDNMDGLAASVAAAAALGFLALTASQEGLAAPLAAALLGAPLGFLVYNSHPAKIFMGDAGSLQLGLLLAVLGLELQTGRGLTEPWVAALVPILVLAVPIFDTTLVTVSRCRRGRNPLTSPGRDHFSHRLIRLGVSVRDAVALVFLAGLACSALAFAAARSGARAALIAVAVFLLIALWAIARLDGPLGSPHDDVGS